MKKLKKNKSLPTITNSPDIKNTSQFSEAYRPLGATERMWLKPDQIIAKGVKLVEWLKAHPEVLSIEDFLEAEEVYESDWYRWL